MNQKTKKTKSMMAVALTIFMVVSMLSGISYANAAGPATLTLVSSTPLDLTYPTTLQLGSTFTVQVNIANVEDLWGVNFDLTWNPDVVTVTKVQKGTFLTSEGAADMSPATAIDNVGGHFPSKFSHVLLERTGVTGGGLLTTITFEVQGFGNCDIALTDVKLLNPQNQEMTYNTPLPSLHVNNPTPAATAPTAAFTVTTNASISGQYITLPSGATTTAIVLDASSSTPGYDGKQAVPITNYSWVIHSVNGLFSDITATTKNVTISDIAPDELQITLNVTAPATNPPAGYVATAQTSRTYTIIQTASAGIDVYTQKGGVGPNAPGGKFGPQQQVVATAHVVFNGAPVAEKDVIFTVYTNSGAEYAYAVARTNTNGDATFSFRLPTPDTQLEIAFGANWAINAAVDISEITYTDSLKFEFNYIANIKNVTVSPSTVVRGTGQVQVTVNLDNSANVTGIVTFTVVDVNNVPIAVVTTTIAGSSVQVTLDIPNYAFVGQAKVNVNLLSAYPKAGGVPYCPQNGATVTFDSSGLFVSGVQNQPAQFAIGI
ncbi:MAG: hypothetical protein LBH74_00470 [Nitrososphaerota archaeon]|jgi:hypothetical protein|nr:hypothetical protein [Nitrososphaerota archaeon]